VDLALHNAVRNFFFESVLADLRQRFSDLRSGCLCSRCLMFDINIRRSLISVLAISMQYAGYKNFIGYVSLIEKNVLNDDSNF